MFSPGLVTPGSNTYQLVNLCASISMLTAWVTIDLAGQVATARDGARLAGGPASQGECNFR
jgi:NO-binding membrane sensor protein with MHYT domain